MKKLLTLTLGLLMTVPMTSQAMPAVKGPSKSLKSNDGTKPATAPKLPTTKGAAQPHGASKGMKGAKTKSSSVPILVVDNYHPYAIDVWTKSPGGDYEYRGRVDEDDIGYYTVPRGYVSTYIECVGLPEEDWWTNTSYATGDYTLKVDY